MTDYYEIISILTALTALSIASYEDLKSREVTSLTWMIAGSVGMAILLIHYQEKVLWSIASISFLFYPAFFEISANIKKILFAVGAALFFATILYNQYIYAIEPPLIVLLAYLLYYTNVLKGGADAKAFMILGILFPHYVSFSIFKVNYEFFNLVFPFALMVIFYASICLIFLIPYYTIRNLISGKIRFPHMLFGYTMKIEDFDKKFVWLMEHVDERGRIYFKLSPQEHREKEDLRKFREMGKNEVWVQPQIPFIFFILIGFIICIILGNPILSIIGR